MQSAGLAIDIRNSVFDHTEQVAQVFARHAKNSSDAVFEKVFGDFLVFAFSSRRR